MLSGLECELPEGRGDVCLPSPLAVCCLLHYASVFIPHDATTSVNGLSMVDESPQGRKHEHPYRTVMHRNLQSSHWLSLTICPVSSVVCFLSPRRQGFPQTLVPLAFQTLPSVWSTGVLSTAAAKCQMLGICQGRRLIKLTELELGRLNSQMQGHSAGPGAPLRLWRRGGQDCVLGDSDISAVSCWAVSPSPELHGWQKGFLQSREFPVLIMVKDSGDRNVTLALHSRALSAAGGV